MNSKVVIENHIWICYNHLTKKVTFPNWRYSMHLNLVSYVAFGLGVVSGLHDNKLKEAGCTLTAAVDPKSSTHAKVAPQTPAYLSFEEYLDKNETPPVFWDVRTPTDSHFTVMRQISQVSATANIIGEKPVCLPEEVEEFRAFLKTHQGKICVNENYLQSNTTKKVKEYVERYLSEIQEVKIEMTKNRSEDFRKGRYQEQRGAFMYEGSHMLCILKQLDTQLVPSAETLRQTAAVSLSDAVVDGKILPYQGSAQVNYETGNGVKVEIYTSMIGKVKNGFFFDNLEKNLTAELLGEEINDVSRRHRVLIIHGVDSQNNPATVLGFYDPYNADKTHGVAGAVFAIKDRQVVERTFPIPDDTMSNNLGAIVEYFKGNRETNPSSPEDALQIVEIMDSLTDQVQ